MATGYDPKTETLRELRLNKKDWAALDGVAKAYRVSRTRAVGQAMTFMINEHFIPGMQPVGKWKGHTLTFVRKG